MYFEIFKTVDELELLGLSLVDGELDLLELSDSVIIVVCVVLDDLELLDSF